MNAVRESVWCWNGDYGDAVATRQEWYGILDDVRFWWDSHRRESESSVRVQVTMPLGQGREDVQAGLELSEEAESAL